MDSRELAAARAVDPRADKAALFCRASGRVLELAGHPLSGVPVRQTDPQGLRWADELELELDGHLVGRRDLRLTLDELTSVRW